jgi:hypothetical protein
MNNDIRTIINTLDSIQEGELGRKIGSKIGSIFGDKGAELGGNLGDKTGDFLDKLNPFSNTHEPAGSKPKDTADTKTSDLTTATTSTAGVKSIAADGTANTTKNAPTGGQWHDIENQYAVDPSKFRIANNWKDGTTGLTADGRLINDYTKKEVTPEILHIEPRKGWTKPMTNFDGSPILASDDNTKPKEPDHPYYHIIFTKGQRAGERYDPLRVGLISLLEKDRYGNQRHHYKDSAVPSIVCNVPNGYTPGGEDLIKQHLVSSKDVIGCYKNANNGVIVLEWQHRGLRLAHTIDDQIRSASETMAGEEIEKYYKGSKVSRIEHGLVADSAVGKWYGNGIHASGGVYKSGGVFGSLTQSIPSTDKEGTPHVDLYNILYWGPTSDWKNNGRSAMTSMASSAKYAEGFGPVKPRVVNEELSRIIDLAWR